MKSLWVTPNESQTDERGVAVEAGAEVAEEEEEEEDTKVCTYISRTPLLFQIYFSIAHIFSIPDTSIYPVLSVI